MLNMDFVLGVDWVTDARLLTNLVNELPPILTLATVVAYFIFGPIARTTAFEAGITS